MGIIDAARSAGSIQSNWLISWLLTDDDSPVPGLLTDTAQLVVDPQSFADDNPLLYSTDEIALTVEQYASLTTHAISGVLRLTDIPVGLLGTLFFTGAAYGSAGAEVVGNIVRNVLNAIGAEPVLEAGDNILRVIEGSIRSLADPAVPVAGFKPEYVSKLADVFGWLADQSLGEPERQMSQVEMITILAFAHQDVETAWKGLGEESRGDLATVNNWVELMRDDYYALHNDDERRNAYEVNIDIAIVSDDVDALETAIIEAYVNDGLTEDGEPVPKEFYDAIWSLHGPSFPQVIYDNPLGDTNLPEFVSGDVEGWEDPGSNSFGLYSGGTKATSEGIQRGIQYRNPNSTKVNSVRTGSRYFYLLSPALYAQELAVNMPFTEGEPRLLDWSEIDDTKRAEEQDEVEEPANDEEPDDDPVITPPDPEPPTEPEEPEEVERESLPITYTAFAALVVLYGFGRAVDMVFEMGNPLPDGWWKLDPSQIPGVHYDDEYSRDDDFVNPYGEDEDDASLTENYTEPTTYEASIPVESEIPLERTSVDAFLVEKVNDLEEEE